MNRQSFSVTTSYSILMFSTNVFNYRWGNSIQICIVGEAHREVRCGNSIQICIVGEAHREV